MTSASAKTPADLNVRLEAMRARTERLVPGPWTWSVGTIEAHDYDGNLVVLFERESNHVTTRNECAFIAHARTDMPKLLAAVDAVVKVFDRMPLVDEYSAEDTEWNRCLTETRDVVFRALTDAIGDEE